MGSSTESGPGAEPGNTPSGEATPGTTSSPEATPGTGAKPSPTAGGMPPAKESFKPKRPGETIVLTGTVRYAEVEKGCLLLDDYLLIGGPRDILRPGARVVVTGHVARDIMTICMVGTPFFVERAQPAP